MISLRVKNAASPFFLISLLMATVALNALATPVLAIGYSGSWGGTTCGYQCMGLTGGMFAPYQGMPMFPSSNGYGYGNASSYSNGYYTNYGTPYGNYGANYGRTGQIPDQRMAMEEALAWNGTQPMGYSYLPPIGLQASQNWVAGSAF